MRIRPAAFALQHLDRDLRFLQGVGHHGLGGQEDGFVAGVGEHEYARLGMSLFLPLASGFILLWWPEKFMRLAFRPNP